MQSRVMLINTLYQDGIYCMSEQVPAEVISLLQQNEIPFVVFAQNPLSSVSELAEEIMGETYEALLFCINEHNIRLLQYLSLEILQSNPDCKIIWYVDGSVDVNIGALIQQTDHYTLSEILTGKTSGIQVYKSNECSYTEANPMLYYYAMSNGYIAYITGIYPDAAVGFYSKHVGYNYSFGDSKTLLLNGYLNINSALIAETETYNPIAYQDFIETAQGTESFISHYHQICAESEGHRIFFDDSKQYLETIEMNYAQFYALNETRQLQPDFLYVLDIVNMEDISCFLSDVQNYSGKGILPFPHFFLKDECRWTGKCNLRYLPRLSVTENGSFQPCLSCSNTLGSLEDSYYSSIRNAARHIDREYVSRDCKDCAVKTICSRCSMLPGFLTNEAYCKLRKEYILISDFLDKKNACQYLLRYTETMKNVNNYHIHVSNHGYSHIFPNAREKTTYDLSKNIYLFFNNNMPLLFDHTRNTLLEIDEILAFIIEGYAKNFLAEEIAHHFANLYKVSEEESLTNVVSGIDYLKNEGLIR